MLPSLMAACQGAHRDLAVSSDSLSITSAYGHFSCSTKPTFTTPR